MIRFILDYIDSAANKTFTIANLGIIGVLFSILMYDDITFKYKNEILLGGIFLFVFILLIIIVAKLFVYFIVLKPDKKLPRTNKIEYRFQFTDEKGSLYTEAQFSQKNKSLQPQRTIIYDFEGLPIDTVFKPQYKVLHRNINGRDGILSISGHDRDISLKRFDDYADNNQNIYQADWAVLLDPPLLPNESVKYIRTSLDKDLYPNILNGEEITFGTRPRVPCRKLSIAIIPPPNYGFDTLNVVIDNQVGEVVRIPNIVLNKTYKWDSNIFHWDIPFPNTSLRYKILFKLIKYD